MNEIRSHWLYRTLEVVGVLIVKTLVCIGIVGAIANLFLWFAK